MPRILAESGDMTIIESAMSQFRRNLWRRRSLRILRAVIYDVQFPVLNSSFPPVIGWYVRVLCPATEPLGKCAECTSLGHCLSPWWPACFGWWKFSRELWAEAFSDLIWCLDLLYFCHLLEEHAPSHPRSQNEKMHAAELGLTHNLEPPSADRSSHADERSHEPGLMVNATLWALCWSMKQHYALKSWLMECFLHGCLFYVLQVSVEVILSKSLILAVVLGTKGQGSMLKWWCMLSGSSICPRKPAQRQQRMSMAKCHRLLESDRSLKGKQQLWYTKLWDMSDIPMERNPMKDYERLDFFAIIHKGTWAIAI